MTVGDTPFRALMVIGYVPVFVGAVPVIVAVPSPLSVKVIPAGSEPDSVSFAVGDESVVTVKLPD